MSTLAVLILLFPHTLYECSNCSHIIVAHTFYEYSSCSHFIVAHFPVHCIKLVYSIVAILCKCCTQLLNCPWLNVVFVSIVSVRLGRIMECSGMFIIAIFFLNRISRILMIDLSSPVGEVNHQWILYKLGSMGIGVSVLSKLTQFLSNRPQKVVVDGSCSKLVNAARECFG